jgi:hypothetical protein
MKLLLTLLPRFDLPAKSRVLLFSALALAVLLNRNAVNYCVAQERQKPKSTESVRQFESPQELAKYWMRAVNRQNWREEYRCYTGSQQAHFTYNITISVREFSDTKDLSDRCHLILRKFNFPSQILNRFASVRTDLSDVTDPREQEAILERLRIRREEQLDQWEREIQPMNLDWAGLIEQLQPLFTESYRRHSHDIHPSSTGIARHLSYHRFNLPLLNRVDAGYAEGTVVAVISDPNVETELDTNTSTSNQPISLTDRIQSFVKAVGFRDRQVKRNPEKITFNKTDGGWRISSAPFR